MGGPYETRADEDAVVGLAGEVWHAVDGAIVLAVGVIELDADPKACGEGGVPDEAHDAATLGDLDDGVERNGGVGHGARRGTRCTRLHARRSSPSQVCSQNHPQVLNDVWSARPVSSKRPALRPWSVRCSV